MGAKEQRQIDTAAKAEFLAGLRRGERREDAAAAAGFSLMGFYGARRRDPAFRADWTAALASSAAAERRVRAYAERGEGGERGEVRIACANRRLYQRRRRRNVRFDADAQAVYLAHFAANCDSKAAAAAAGVHESTVRLHRRMNPVFAAAEAQALADGYFWLEAEAVRLGLETQKRLRAAVEADYDPPRDGESRVGLSPAVQDRSGGAIDPTLDHPQGGGGGSPPSPSACPECSRRMESDAEFDRIMKLLARHDRKPRRAERGFQPGGRRQRMTFEMAIVLLDKRLRALGLRHPPPPAVNKEGQEGAE